MDYPKLHLTKSEDRKTSKNLNTKRKVMIGIMPRRPQRVKTTDGITKEQEKVGKKGYGGTKFKKNGRGIT